MLKKLSALAVLFLLIPSLAFASYIVVLKDGKRYRAKEKWTIQGGKAIIKLESGSSLQLDPSLIDVKASEQANSSGMGDVRILEVEEAPEPEKPKATPLGSLVTIKRAPDKTSSSSAPISQAPSNSPKVSGEAVQRFMGAYDNVGLYDAKVTAVDSNRLRVELTADSEDQVFKAISATAFIMSKLPESTSEELDMVELFMKTISGGSSGRFQMTPKDARELAEKKLEWQDYFVNNVLF